MKIQGKLMDYDSQPNTEEAEDKFLDKIDSFLDEARLTGSANGPLDSFRMFDHCTPILIFEADP